MFVGKKFLLILYFIYCIFLCSGHGPRSPPGADSTSDRVQTGHEGFYRREDSSKGQGEERGSYCS